MKLYTLVLSAGLGIILTACGGGGGGKSSDTPPLNSSTANNITNSSSAAPSSVAQASITTSSLQSSSNSSSSLYCPAGNSWPDCPSTTWNDDYCTLRGPSLCVRSSSSNSLSSSSQSSHSSSVTPVAFTMTSTGFVSDSTIPNKYSCYSSEISPQLKWEITSEAVKSFALVMEDIDAIPIVNHPYVHWNVYNIPGSAREITEGATLHAMPLGSVEGANDDGSPKYAGPCPPVGTGTHHYYFALYALNKETIVFNTGHSIERGKFETDHAADIIQKVELIGLFTR